MCYTTAVQTSFYASGFLYSPKLHKILLLKSQQRDSADFLWSTLGGECSGDEDAQAAFARIISELLDLNLKAKDIHPVYNYFHDEKNKNNFVFYGEVKKLQDFKDDTFSWVSFHDTLKFLFSAHSKQDVIVGERVIHAKWREDEAKKLLPVSI